MEPKPLDGSDYLLYASEAALSHNGRSNNSVNAVLGIILALLQHVDDIEYQRAVGNGTKGAADHTGSTRDAFIVVDDSLVILLTNGESLGFATLDTGPFLGNDGTIGASRSTFATLNAFLLIDMAAMVDNGDSTLRAYLLT
jgi:hypothetical protein